MRRLALTVSAILAMAGLSFPASLSAHKGAETKGARSFVGEIMDSPCAKMNSHEQMGKMEGIGRDSKMCTLKCVEIGGKFVLQNTAKEITYQLDDQEKPKGFAGQRVKVTGTYDAKTSTIHVEKIEAAE